MIKYFTIIGLLLGAFLLVTCQNKKSDYSQKIQNTQYYHRAMKKLTDVIVHDIFSPPVAARIYAYPNVAAYQAMLPTRADYQSLAGQLTDLKPSPQPEKDKEYCYELASLHAFLIVGKKWIFSEEKIETFEKEFYAELKGLGIPSDVYERSMQYGAAVAKHIIDWSLQDQYRETRTFPKYTIDNVSAKWQPTPPAYMEGIEPHWNKIRPFVLDSAAIFAPPPPTTFNKEKNSQFYQETLEVYETAKKLSAEQEAIARFWDCNPFVTNISGHAMYATKKISPGGHWMGIAKIAAQQAQLDWMATIEVYTKVSIALMDGFISCWDEKWRSILVRPETVINQYIDKDWKPLLQTPPFPEYTSGHSVISNASAEVLTDLLGDNFAYTDSTEVEYGLKARTFKSFRHAAQEAAISRLYGGIHYMPAIKNGSEQGKKVGLYIVKKLKMRKRNG
ncbi:MAG: vanadium-dependent haloperoxidase [Microscillaceae bacterium]|jgi:hypothetical protein|nr:vanadium-dependent haloperoxidase [Microscillaceae bacterium]